MNLPKRKDRDNAQIQEHVRNAGRHERPLGLWIIHYIRRTDLSERTRSALVEHSGMTLEEVGTHLADPPEDHHLDLTQVGKAKGALAGEYTHARYVAWLAGRGMRQSKKVDERESERCGAALDIELDQDRIQDTSWRASLDDQLERDTTAFVLGKLKRRIGAAQWRAVRRRWLGEKWGGSLSTADRQALYRLRHRSDGSLDDLREYLS